MTFKEPYWKFNKEDWSRIEDCHRGLEELDNKTVQVEKSSTQIKSEMVPDFKILTENFR